MKSSKLFSGNRILGQMLGIARFHLLLVLEETESEAGDKHQLNAKKAQLNQRLSTLVTQLRQESRTPLEETFTNRSGK